MRSLKYTAPEIYQEFQSENHPVKRSDNSIFNQVWTDMGLEQSLNRDSKTSGGIVGFTLEHGAVDRRFLTAHEKLSTAAAIKIMCRIEEQGGQYGDKKLAEPRKQRDENDIRALIRHWMSLCYRPGQVLVDQ